MDIWSGILPLVGVVVGGVVTTLSQTFISRRDRSARKLSLAYGIASEIEAYLALIRQRRMLEKFERMYQLLEASSQPFELSKMLPKTDATLNSFPVFQAGIRDIGLLGEKAGDVSKFYQSVLSIRSTWNEAAIGAMDQLIADEQTGMLREEIEFWKHIDHLGNTLVKELRSSRN